MNYLLNRRAYFIHTLLGHEKISIVNKAVTWNRETCYSEPFVILIFVNSKILSDSFACSLGIE